MAFLNGRLAVGLAAGDIQFLELDGSVTDVISGAQSGPVSLIAVSRISATVQVTAVETAAPGKGKAIPLPSIGSTELASFIVCGSASGPVVNVHALRQTTPVQPAVRIASRAFPADVASLVLSPDARWAGVACIDGSVAVLSLPPASAAGVPAAVPAGPPTAPAGKAAAPAVAAPFISLPAPAAMSGGSANICFVTMSSRTLPSVPPVTHSVLFAWPGYSAVTKYVLPAVSDDVKSGSGPLVPQMWTLPYPVCCAAQSNNGILLAVALGDGSLVVFDAVTGMQVFVRCCHLSYSTAGTHRNVLKRHASGTPTALAFLGDGYLASGGSDGAVQLYDAATGTLLYTMKEASQHIQALFSASNLPIFATLDAEGQCRVYDSTEGKVLGKLVAPAQLRLVADKARDFNTDDSWVFLPVSRGRDSSEVLKPVVR